MANCDDNEGGDNGDDGDIGDLEDDFEQMFRNLEIENAANLTRECTDTNSHVESEVGFFQTSADDILNGTW